MDHLMLTHDGLRFEALATGPADGHLVLLLHGFPQVAEAWEDVVVPVGQAGFRVVAPYQRGYSSDARPPTTAGYRLEHLTGDVLAWADSLGASQFSVVGHDWGGMVAWTLAAAHPERVAKLVAVSTPHPRALRRVLPRSTQPLRSAYVLLFRTPGVAEAALGAGDLWALRRSLRSSGLPERHLERTVAALRAPGALTAALRWYRAARPRDFQVEPVAVPTLYVWGERDPALGPEAARGTAAQVTGPYRFVPLDEGHWLPERRPAELAGLVVEHLRQ